MLISPTDIAPVLKSLIETCRDGQEGFRSAAESLKHDERLRTFLFSCADQRARFAKELEAESQKLGEPYHSRNGSISGSLHRGWIHLKGTLSSNDPHSILAECERGEDSAVKEYKEALAAGLPALLHGVIERQYREIQIVHHSVREARDAQPTLMHSSGNVMGEIGYKSRELASQAEHVATNAMRQGMDYARKNPLPIVIGAFGLGLALTLGFGLRRRHEREERRLSRRFSRAVDRAHDAASELRSSMKPLVKILRSHYQDSSESMRKAYNQTSRAVKDATDDLTENMDVKSWVKPALKKIRRFF